MTTDKDSGKIQEIAKLSWQLNKRRSDMLECLEGVAKHLKDLNVPAGIEAMRSIGMSYDGNCYALRWSSLRNLHLTRDGVSLDNIPVSFGSVPGDIVRHAVDLLDSLLVDVYEQLKAEDDLTWDASVKLNKIKEWLDQ